MMLTFRFRQSRSDELPWRLALAKRGAYREQALSPKQMVYEATFELLDPIQLSQAISLATALVHDKTAEALTEGHSWPMPMVREVLSCFQRSQSVEDYRAHCWFRALVRPDTGVIETAPVQFPCRQAAGPLALVHPDQPGLLHHQVEAALLRAGTRWCPRLADLTEWTADARQRMKERR